MTASTPPDPQWPASASKAEWRARMRERRAALPPDARAAAAAAVCQGLVGLDALAGNGPVLLYAAFGDELDVDGAIEVLLARGTTVCLPRVRGEALDVVPVRGLAELVPGWPGVREPPAEAAVVPAAALVAVVVPGLAFDLDGNRLGYGGGHFDRLLAELAPDALRVGVAHDLQVVERLPAEAHDRPVDVVLTECRLVRPG